jgi:hypothetical protein
MRFATCGDVAPLPRDRLEHLEVDKLLNISHAGAVRDVVATPADAKERQKSSGRSPHQDSLDVVTARAHHRAATGGG